MRKIFLTSLLVVLMVFGVAAESSFGIKGGLTLGRISNDDIPGLDEKFKMGFAGGAMMIMPLNEQMHLQAEALYVMKGEKRESSGEEAFININVIEIPVLVKFMASKYMSVYGGPSFNYIMTAEAEYPDETVDIKDYLKEMSFGLSFGAQYIMNQIIFDARYDMGLTNIIDEEGGESEELKLNTIYVTVGYLF